MSKYKALMTEKSPSIENYKRFREIAAALGVGKPPTEAELARAREIEARRLARQPHSAAKTPSIMAGALAAERRFRHLD